jgi:hypothetical protein
MIKFLILLTKSFFEKSEITKKDFANKKHLTKL